MANVKKAAENVVSDVEQEVEKVVNEVKGDVEKDAPAVEGDVEQGVQSFKAAVDQVEEDVTTQSGPIREEVYQDALVAEDQAKKALVVLRQKVGIGQVHLEEDLVQAQKDYDEALAKLKALEQRLFSQPGGHPFRPGTLNDGNP